MNLNFNKRKFWHFHNYEKSISIEIAGWNSNPSLSIRVDGDERDITFNISFGFAFYLSFNNFFPKKWYPKYLSKNHGYLPSERELSLKIHGGVFWWNFWTDPDSYDNRISKIRRGCFHFLDSIKGKYIYKSEELEKEHFLISMLEGCYNVWVTKNLITYTYPRWFTKKIIQFEVKAGYYDNKNNWIDCGIPIEGKGTMSYNCDEDATYSSSFPENWKNLPIKTCQEAALFFESDMKKDRINRGGRFWIPENFKNKGLNIILNTSINQGTVNLNSESEH